MKSKITIYLKKQILILICLISGIVFSQTPVTYTANPTNAQINAALIGSNINITGGALNFGDRATQIATFTNGNGAALQMNSGVFFGTGTVAKLLTTNNATQSTDDIPTAATFSDSDLATIDNTATRDVVSYSFTVTLGPKATTLNIKYQFGSEEYPDYVGSAYDDAMGFFVTGPGITGTANLARLPNNNPISINKVNFGVPGASGTGVAAYDGTQGALYTNNGHPTTVVGGKLIANDNSGAKPIAVQFNGITKLITYSLSGLTPGGTYTFKIIIADAGDASLDSGFFINTIYGTATIAANNDTYTILSGSNTSVSVLNNDVVNGVPPASLNDVLLTQVSTTNSGVVLNPATGLISVTPGTPPGVYTVTYQICDQTFTSNCKTAVATVNVLINDSDGDGHDDFYDLDDDNDGILDCAENGLNKPVNQIFKLNGNAIQISPSEVQLTPASNSQAGQMWSYGKVDFTKNFSMPFEAYLGNNDAGADGMAIVFQNDPTGINAIGAAGDGIGARGIQNGVVLELDTYSNTGSPALDPAADHGQIWKSSDQTAITSTVALPNLEDGAWHAVVVNWDSASQKLSYTVDGTVAGTYTGNIVTNYFGGANKVYFGFTASTGGLNNDQRVRFSSLCSLPLELDTDGDGTPNSLDLDSDGDGCFDAIEGGDNVTASMLNGIGRINVAANGSTTPVVVDANGVPVVTNTGSAYNVDGQAQGQAIGQSQINNPAAVAGTVGSNQTIVSGASPSALSLTGSTGTIQWQSSTDNVTFTNISGATSASYSPGSLTTNTYYRAVVSSAGGCTVNTNVATITVVPNTDSDGDGVIDYNDLDDDNDGILDVSEECNGFRTQNSTGVWNGDTVSNLTANFTGASPQTNVQNLTDLQINYYINQNGGQQRVAKSDNVNFSLSFSTPVKASEIAFYIEDVDPSIATGSPTAQYTFLVNGAASASFTSVNVGGVSPYLVYNGATGLITLSSSSNDHRILLKGIGNQLISSITLTSTGIGTGDAVAYSLLAKKSCDTDLDGTPDYLDLDSDADGCPDALEGDENVTAAQLASNRISGSVDVNGVPNIVNSGGAADVGGDQGQGTGSSQNSGIQDINCLTSFGCTSSMYLSQGTNTSLYNVSTATNPFTYPAIGSASGINYNAIGLNPLNGFIYGVLANTNQIVRINSDGTYNNLGAITGLPTSVIYNAGEIDHLGNYYVKVNTDNSQLYKINLSTLSASLITLSSSINVPDIAYRTTDGLIYGVNSTNGQLVSINPSNGTVTGIGITPSAVNFGAMFGSSTGEIFGVNNTGGFYQFNLTNGQRVLISGAPASSANDGAHCVTAPITFSADLYVTKTDGKTVYSSGGSTTYTVVVGNNGPFGVLNATVSDLVPSGIPNANMTYTASVAGGATTNVVGTQTGAINDLVSLPVGGTVTYTVLVNIPSNFSGNLVNTATITPPTNTNDSNNANNSATDTDLGTCYKPAQTTGITLDTNHGITALGRAGADNSNWPMVRKGAWTVLEAKTKGFVVNRLTDAQIVAIPAVQLVEGMMVYNISQDCLQINIDGTPTGWKCFNTQTCPN